MNRRIVIVDTKVVCNPLRYYGCGLGSEIYQTDQIEHMSEAEVNDTFGNIGQSDAALLVGSGAFQFLRRWYHYGIRGENYFDCTFLRRLSIEGGGFIKVIHETDFPSKAQIEDFMSPEFCQTRTFPDWTGNVIKTYFESLPWLEYFLALPQGTQLGFDYETSGMAMEIRFSITGVSLSTENKAIFFSFQYIKRDCSDSEWADFMERFRAIIEKHQRGAWVYNLQFEQQVTWREFGLDTELCDASVYNVLDGLHSKNYSLKWTAQRLLQVNVWDTDFDRLDDLLSKMYFVEVPIEKGKKATRKELKVTPDNYQDTPEWSEICSRYPEYIAEFIDLIDENFGNPFLNIPADILGFYCNLDAFYTLQIHLQHQNRYSSECRETYLDNMRLGARLHQGGMYKDEAFRLAYDAECSRLIAYGITYAATVRTKMKMDKHKVKANSLKSYSKVAQKLLNRGEFHEGDTLAITKDILSKSIDTMDTNETGLNEGNLLLTYGATFAEPFVDLVYEAMKETKYKGKLDINIGRKKKLLGYISERIGSLIGLDKIKLGRGHVELEKFLWYEKAYKAFMDIWERQMPDINHVPLEFQFLGQTYGQDEYWNMILNTYFKCSSPIDSAEITHEMTEAYKLETTFLTTIYAGQNKLPGGKDYYKNLGITDVTQGYEHFCAEYQIYCANLDKKGTCVWPFGYSPQYPLDTFPTASIYWSNIDHDDMTTTWDSFDGYLKQTTYFSDQKADWSSMSEPYRESDFDDRFKFMRKMVLHIMLAKKYMKVKSTYMEGLFLDNDRCELDTGIFVPTRYADPSEPGAVVKMHPKYEVLKKETKRWSSAYHTIISHSDIKSVINSPRGYLLSYFDISSAEVRTCAYMSKDPVMIHLFETHQDLYIHVAKIYFGEDRWNGEDGAFKATWRKRFKTVLLGVMYGMGCNTLAGRLGVDPKTAQELIDTLFGQFKVLKKYIEKNMQYPLDHEGQLDTLMGDMLKSPAWRFVVQPDGKPDRAALAKVSRHGINYIIQSASAVSLARGFWNNIREAKKAGFVLEPIIVVHDSNTNYFPVDKLFDIKAFYDKNFTEFCENQLHVPFLFDLLVGENYNDAVTLKQLEPNKIELDGNAHSILKILAKVRDESGLHVSLNVPIESIQPNYIENPIERFIREKGCSMIMDTSSYKIELTKEP